MFFDLTYNSKILKLYKGNLYNETGEFVLGTPIAKDNIARFEKRKKIRRTANGDEFVSDAILYSNCDIEIEEDDIVEIFDKEGVFSLGLFRIIEARGIDALTISQKNSEYELQEYRI